jgi:hypothetical protein
MADRKKGLGFSFKLTLTTAAKYPANSGIFQVAGYICQASSEKVWKTFSSG